MKRFIKIICIFAAALLTVYLFRGDFADFARDVFPFDYKLEISAGAAEFDLDPLFVAAVIKAESSFNPEATSGVAHGLMQLTDDTAAYIAEKAGMDYEKRLAPRTNIRMGCWYLSYLIKQFGDINAALAAYNAGPAAVSRWLADERLSSNGKTLDKIPFDETRNYVRRIGRYYKMYQKLY